MTIFKISLLVVSTLCSLSASHGQELTRKKKYKDLLTEEFFVLKEDRNIRQGASLTTYKDILDKKYIVDFGEYKQNKKSGRWLAFYFVNPYNFLKSMGPYANGLKEGSWRYYYPASADKNLAKLFGSDKRTNVIDTKKDLKTVQIQYDTTGQQVSCTGQYKQDKKSGIWNYYSRSGYLLHSYDHDSSQFSQNNLRDRNNDFLVFLGGQERFYNCYYTGQQEIITHPRITRTSEVIYEIEKSGKYTLISAGGDPNYEALVEQTLKTIPDEWISLNADSTRKLRLVAKIEVTANSFSKYKSSLDLKVID